MQQTASLRTARPAAPALTAETPAVSEVLMGLLISLGSGILYFVWKSQAGIWRTSTFNAIVYLGVLVLAVACQQELLRLPWPGLQQGAAAFLAVLVALCSLGHFDFTAGTIGYEAGGLYAAAVMLYRLHQAKGLGIAPVGLMRRFTDLIVALGGAIILLSLYCPWTKPVTYQVMVNNKVTPLTQVDPRFLEAMHIAYVPRTAFVATWALPAAGVALGIVLWALMHRPARTGWLLYAPLLAATALTLWGMLLWGAYPGPYIFGGGLSVLVVGGLAAGIRSQLETVRPR